ncbi:uncharacterized protein RHIMIDRAFT_262999 [Rhizopus microsporus ATCC 52813]|uniref:Uncharacterized protein n=1 Tax=Rhizopus microsporus ATCC 52813 TaxID=1340429 RepID=A0A2G4SL88_RHIZD|nr:uncharacterized protein RHIMIDRAFT_262999 [Rhizopus microsporus ATCC 52813]PHZ09502.1 hypothetical protein RHIMIDRAFT_262999 [Rhizopus microsporus ATCC 52813]
MANNRLPCPPESERQLTHAQVIENSLFSPNVNAAQDFTFSGTDNGLHTMTDTVAFTLKRFKFHLELYNRYYILGDVQNDDPHLADILERYHNDAIDSECMDENVSYLDLPNSFKLERDKKRIVEGQIVQSIENNLPKFTMDHTVNVEEIKEVLSQQYAVRDTLRKLYYSNKRVKEERTTQVQQKRTTIYS